MLFIPDTLAPLTILQSEGYAVSTFAAGSIPQTADLPKGTLRILFLNIMPEKERTELDIARMMAAQHYDVALLPMKIEGQTYKTTAQEYVEQNYIDYTDYAAHGHYDGLIITGAPVEHMPFEEVRYWPRLCRIMDDSASLATSTLFICWGAQAGLYHFYGVEKHGLDAKKFGIFSEDLLPAPTAIALEGILPQGFPMPHSRHTAIDEGLARQAPLHTLAQSEATGTAIMANADGSRVFITGHLEYAADTLDREYHRDLAKNLPITMPENYYIDNDPNKGIDFAWNDSARRFYGYWLGLCRRGS